MQIPITIPSRPTGRLTSLEKALYILAYNPESRDSYDIFVTKYESLYGLSKKRETVERYARFIQCDLGLFPPSERVRKARLEKQKEIIEAKKKRKGFFGKILSLIFRKGNTK